ncbi:hypothetical protein [Cryptosporangium arvum]|uniref:hypothetical protein n=1 Tax=Cryptosporangium arvum TaxID=80871 RepID=UPI0012EED363|nr:hypothetical protein [Cryptosporangium arvum]
MTGHLRVWLAILLSAAGTLLLIARLVPEVDLLELALRWWPIVLIGLGVIGILNLVRAHVSLVAPLGVIGLGGILLVFTLDPLPDDYKPIFVPLLLLLSGLALLAQGALSPRVKNSGVKRKTFAFSGKFIQWNPGDEPLAIVQSLFSGCIIEVSSTSGDLKDARLEVTALAGSVEIRFSDMWTVDLATRNSGQSIEQSFASSPPGGPRLKVVALSLGAAIRTARLNGQVLD